MNYISKFLIKHSQKIALAGTLGTLGTVYLIQPYYETLTRWSITEFAHTQEAETPERISRLLKDVCSQFNLTDYQKSQLDVFITQSDEPLALGSLKSRGYAFIGIPKMFGYENTSQIPVESFDFYTSRFPYGPFSEMGQRRLELMTLPDSALRFVLAREIVRLQGQTKDGLQLSASARTHAMVTIGSLVGALYLSYQAAYIMNRSVCLRWPPIRRAVLYTGICLVSLFCQHQILLAWRRHRCTKTDRIVASLGNSYRQGGLDYYRWRLDYNKFWAERHKEFKKALKDKKNSADQFDPVACYQNEIKQGKTKPKNDDYYLPQMLPDQSTNKIDPRTLRSRNLPSPRNYHRFARFTDSGNELWAADGDALGLGLTQILIVGILPKFVSWFFSLFSNPATSRSRIANLEALPVADT